MASGRLRRVQAKAQRRKKLLAERRKANSAAGGRGVAAEIRRAAIGTIETCAVQAGLLEHGNGMVALTRRTSQFRVACVMFMVDSFCLGVKDVLFRHADEAEIEMMLEDAGRTAPLDPVEPAYARKLLRDVVAYARALGIEPHADYAAAEALFGDVATESCDAAFEFGREGRPVYVPGPFDSPTQIRRRTEQLRRAVGEAGFDVVDAEEAFDLLEADEEDWDDEAEGGYDAEIAPDAEAWLALGVQERIALVATYHDRLGVELENEQAHAVLHAIVENQIALGDELPVRRAMERLMAEGLPRHDAIHAIGAVLAAHFNEAMQDESSAEGQRSAYHDAVERLTAESWRREFEAEED